MPHSIKPAFEQFRHAVIKAGRPMLEKNVVPIQAAVVTSFETFPELLVEKARRLPHHEAMIEISAKWLGVATDQDEVIALLKREWNDGVLGADHCKFHVGPVDERVVLQFAANYEDSRYVTGRVSVTF